MPGALIVSSGEKGRDMLCGVLTDMGAGDISTVTSGAEARRGFCRRGLAGHPHQHAAVGRVRPRAGRVCGREHRGGRGAAGEG